MHKHLPILPAILLAAGLFSHRNLQAQATLSASPYVENFDQISAGLPAGFLIKTGASATAAGTDASLTTAATSWSSTKGQFANFASATDKAATTAAADQSTDTNRALGIRQTGSVGDPGAAFVFQVQNTTGKKSLKLNFKLQSLDQNSPRIATWTVQYGIGADPASYSAPVSITGTLTTGGATFSNNDISVDFGNALDNSSDIITIRIIALSSTTASGNRPSTAIDDFSLSWENADPTAPVLTATDAAHKNISNLTFPTTPIGTPSVQSFYVNGSRLTSAVTLKTTGTAFDLSTDGTSFTPSLTIAASAASAKQVYVRFSPASALQYADSLYGSAEGADSIKLSLNGIGTDPNSTEYNFNTTANGAAPGDGFTAYSVTGDGQVWNGTTYGISNTNGININGYAGGAQYNEDWLISPKITKTFQNMPVLSYESRGEYTGPALTVWISTDYDGIGNPDNFTWVNLNGSFPDNDNTWTLTDNLDLSAYKGTPFYIAFKYVSSPTDGAARWTLDDISIKDQTALFAVTPAINDFGNVAVGTVSAAKPISLRSVGHGDITVTAPANFELSADSSSYTASLNISSAEAEAGKKIYVRFAPAIKALSITDTLDFTATDGVTSSVVRLTGSSYPHDETFDVAAYNMSFFGSSGSSAILRTPAQITQQINNIETVLEHLDADVVSFEEMSSDSSLNVLLTKLNQKTGKHYQSLVSDAWSHKESTDTSYPPQKIGFIYNADVVSLDPAAPPRAMFNEGFTAGNVYASDFWASGRLPYMATFIARIQGIQQRIRMIVIHGKAGSDPDSYARRVSDNQVLYDSLATSAYDNDNIMIMGDFNDRLSTSIDVGQNSSYQVFVNDNAYNKLTYSLDTSGAVSFVSGTGLIDNMLFRKAPQTTTATLRVLVAGSDQGLVYIDSSMVVADPRSYISPYNDVVSSDHLPVFSRFVLASTDAALPVSLTDLKAVALTDGINISWKTMTASSVRNFIVERAADGKTFTPVGTVTASGTSTTESDYALKDAAPVTGLNYYRIRTVAQNGAESFSDVVSVKYSAIQAPHTDAVQILPNPVHSQIRVRYTGSSANLHVRVYDLSGRMLMQANGAIEAVNTQLNSQITTLAAGLYLLRLTDGQNQYSTKFIKR